MTGRETLLALLVARLDSGSCPRTPEPFVRAAGDVPCEACGLPYRRHPTHGEHDWLHVRCDGVLLKL